MGTFINITDTDAISGIFPVSPIRALGREDQENQNQTQNRSTDIVNSLQPLNRTGQELIDRFRSIDSLEDEVETRQRASELFTELQDLLDEPTQQNLAAADDVRKELSELSFTNENGETQNIIEDENFTRVRFTIPGEQLENLGDLITENANRLDEAEDELDQERADLDEFFTDTGLQTGSTFNSQGEVITSFINVESTGQLLNQLI